MTDVEFIRGEASSADRDDLPATAKRLNAIAGRLKVLEATVAKLPKTVDGVTKVPGDTVWRIEDDGRLSERIVQWKGEYNESEPCYWAYWGISGPPVPVDKCYSTLEAAEAASKPEEVCCASIAW